MAWIFFIMLLFLIHDFINLQVKTYGQWLASDYAFRAVIIVVVISYEPFRKAVADAVRLPVAVWKVVSIAIVVTAFGIVTHYLIEIPLFHLFPTAVAFPYPQPTSTFLHAIDLIIGLVLVATSEEFVFRLLMPQFLSGLHTSKAFVLFGSSLLFGLIHWEHGVGSVVAAFIIGIALMYSVQRTDSLRPALLAHYLINFWFFW